MGGRAVLARSFARIAEANLKKQGVLPLTFADPADYDKIRADDVVDLDGLAALAPGSTVQVVVAPRRRQRRRVRREPHALGRAHRVVQGRLRPQSARPSSPPVAGVNQQWSRRRPDVDPRVSRSNEAGRARTPGDVSSVSGTGRGRATVVGSPAARARTCNRRRESPRESADRRRASRAGGRDGVRGRCRPGAASTTGRAARTVRTLAPDPLPGFPDRGRRRRGTLHRSRRTSRRARSRPAGAYLAAFSTRLSRIRSIFDGRRRPWRARRAFGPGRPQRHGGGVGRDRREQLGDVDRARGRAARRRARPRRRAGARR